MTVSVESVEHKHRPRIYITDAANIVSLYTMSHLLNTQDNFRIYFDTADEECEEASNELIKKICPRAIRESSSKGMERSIIFLREGMDENTLKAPLEGNHRFVLIISMIGAENPSLFPFSQSISKLEQEAKNIGYESYCILRLPPIFQHLNSLQTTDLESLGDDSPFYAIDADDVGSAVSQILIDPDLHKGEQYTIFCHSPISPSSLKTIHSQLPRVPGRPFQSSKSILESINSAYWKYFEDSGRRNDFNSITGDEEMSSFEEFLRRTNHSLFHQRFFQR